MRGSSTRKWINRGQQRSRCGKSKRMHVVGKQEANWKNPNYLPLFHVKVKISKFQLRCLHLHLHFNFDFLTSTCPGEPQQTYFGQHLLTQNSRPYLTPPRGVPCSFGQNLQKHKFHHSSATAWANVMAVSDTLIGA